MRPDESARESLLQEVIPEMGRAIRLGPPEAADVRVRVPALWFFVSGQAQRGGSPVLVRVNSMGPSGPSNVAVSSDVMVRLRPNRCFRTLAQNQSLRTSAPHRFGTLRALST